MRLAREICCFMNAVMKGFWALSGSLHDWAFVRNDEGTEWHWWHCDELSSRHGMSCGALEEHVPPAGIPALCSGELR